MKYLLPLLALLTAPLVPVTGHAESPKAAVSPFARWEPEIAAMEAADKISPPPKGGVLFIGSSTIRLWKSLAADFPRHPVINRGFGGSHIVDSTHFAPRLVFPFEPKLIFLRAGGNDINAGKTPEQVFADYKEFVAAIHARLPKTEIAYLGLCPTIARITEVEKGDTLNGYIKAFAAQNPLLKYVDCTTLSVDAAGRPRPELFMPDKLHFNEAGYRLLAERTRPFLPAPVK